MWYHQPVRLSENSPIVFQHFKNTFSLLFSIYPARVGQIRWLETEGILLGKELWIDGGGNRAVGGVQEYHDDHHFWATFPLYWLFTMSTDICVSGNSSLLSQEEILDCRVTSYWNCLHEKARDIELRLILLSDLLILCFHFPLGLERVHTELVFLFIPPTVR